MNDETFSIHLQRHGDVEHVTKFADHQYPNGKPAEQPRWDATLRELNALGYEVVHEFSPTAGERRVQMSRRYAPSLIERLLPPVSPKPAVAVQETAPMPAKAPAAPAPEVYPAAMKAALFKKFGRL